MKMLLIAALGLGMWCVGAEARPTFLPSLEEKYKLAEVIVIARPIAVKDTSERIDLPGIMVGGTPPKGLRVVGVNTTFEVISVRKGSPELKEIVLHHYRREVEPDPARPGFNAAQLVTFDPAKGGHYLLFLKREVDGRYAPLDQVDPGTNSVEQVPSGER